MANITAPQTTTPARVTLFSDPFHDEFGQWPLAWVPYGGTNIGDVMAVADAVGDGDDSAFYEAWVAAGDAKNASAEAALAAGHQQSARELFLTASCLYSAAYHPIFGDPVDPRLLAAYDKQMAAFDRVMAMSPFPVSQVRIPFEGAQMSAYLIPAVGHETQKRPTIIFNNGYDATITDLYFSSALAATRRGYHALLFDGPGQGDMLYHQGTHLRPDWEVVIGAVIDYAETVDIVDAKKIAINGWSLGGYFAPRAASAEPRLAACIADPGQWDIGEAFRGFAMKLGASPEEVADLSKLDDAFYDRFTEMVQSDRKLRWSIVQRGFWANGVSTMRDFVAKSAQFTFTDRVGDIQCPTLLTAAENDPLAQSTEAFYDALTCPKKLLRFTVAEGAGEHCEMTNRSLLNQRVFDWLDETLLPNSVTG